MCLACLGFMLVLVLLRIAGVPLGTPFLTSNTKTKRSRAGRCGLQGQLKRMRKEQQQRVLRGEGSKGKIYLLAKAGDLPVGAAVRVYGTVKKPESPQSGDV